ncbi:MarR family winged helix-turn-helix transcriptional regulator [Amycolatopsis australiensis]|uniref:DNA-binding transcriptional regulator, MarR family n=1 Tax=Amycolatopsis australiensis TaxID=546364 RepID=A0A1K1RD23_9PSEU|nr:MarR family winged helix-turn-helix transcriptional regulator [Amycolatopsis australiensis]SFW69833.1 DNA-binding transcriptional regulator, MarR family [Amycolatopsis australiensis]
MEAQPVDPATLGMLLYRAHRLARAKSNEAARPAGIELQHAGVLSAVRTGGVRSQRELGAALGVDKSTLVRIVDDLERRNLVRRQRSRHDRRAYEIVLTEDGERRLDEANGLFADAMSGLLKVFDDEERHRLHELLSRFVAQD